MSTETRDAADAYALAHIDEFETTWIAEHLRKFAAAENAKLLEALRPFADCWDEDMGVCPMKPPAEAWKRAADIISTAPQPSDAEKLDRIIAADLDHMLTMTEAEVLAEAAENGDDASQVRGVVRAAVAAANERVRCNECDWEGPVTELRGDAGDCPNGCSGTAVSAPTT